MNNVIDHSTPDEEKDEGMVGLGTFFLVCGLCILLARNFAPDPVRLVMLLDTSWAALVTLLCSCFGGLLIAVGLVCASQNQ